MPGEESKKWSTTADRVDTASKNEALPTKNILIVDDNEEFRAIIKQTFELAGYNFLEAADGEEALLIFQNSDKVDLIICDIILPGMNGPELVDELRKVCSDVKVIFMSGYVNDGIVSQDVDPVLGSGGHFIQKPFLARNLLAAIDCILEN